MEGRKSSVGPSPRYYVRFGEPPADERSEFAGTLRTEAATPALWLRGGLLPSAHKKEDGVSVFEAALEGGALVVDTGGGANFRLRETFKLFTCLPALYDRPLYGVAGDVVGRGAGGEPLLRNCRVAEVRLDVPVVLDSYGGDGELARGVEMWNRWRRLDGAREGHRTPIMGTNYREAYGLPVRTPWADRILHGHGAFRPRSEEKSSS